MLNISLPEQVQTFVEEQAIAAGFDSANEYVCHLILRERERISQQEQIQSLLLEGLESRYPVEAAEDWLEQKRTQLAERFQQSDI